MTKAIIKLESLACPSCMQKIEGAVKNLAGVETGTVKVLFNSGKVKLDFNEQEVSIAEIEAAITNQGYTVIKSTTKPV
ncbi:cation transporter [Facklamia sp. DSM 111018]|uniref:Cation transporter n=1 Tax=Facklamia lactis TaxID=2749967 RepID=A0ABS0LS88_9LACT|nr:cation transporter [Facklamia lactis]MBG9981223.1 cation transporter [Facklamia lactis]MBG9987025.1 cation transporter [Facklamia lactis]